MAGVNKVILIGHLGKNPEVRTIEGGAKVCNFSLATSESYKDKNGDRKETTEWHNIVLWRGLAEVAEKYLLKGSQIYLEGKIRTRSWEKDGIKRYTTEIIGESFTFLGKPKQQEENNNPPQGEFIGNDSKSEDDLPF